MSAEMKLLVGVIAATLAATAARADTINYDTSLAAGYYNGSGNPNVGFTTDTNNGVQLGLGVNLRFIGPVLPSSTNNYFVPTGTSGKPPSGAATWDFLFSVDFGSTGLTTTDTTALLTIDNVGAGKSFSFDPSTISDNATNGKGYQNAENLGFAFLASNLLFNPNSPDEYIVTLTLSDSTGQLASVTENINATPLPAALPLFVSGLGGLGFFGWRKKRRSQMIAA
jgi:hypothetical protein